MAVDIIVLARNRTKKSCNVKITLSESYKNIFCVVSDLNCRTNVISREYLSCYENMYKVMQYSVEKFL